MPFFYLDLYLSLFPRRWHPTIFVKVVVTVLPLYDFFAGFEMGLGSIRLLPSHFSLRCCKVCYTTLFQKELCHIWGRGDLVINLNILGQKTSCLGTKSYQPRPPHPGSSSFQWEQWSLTNCHNKVIELQLISLQIIHFLLLM